MGGEMTEIIPDLEKLLQPISEDAPSGSYLRYDSVYDRIEECRKADDPNLPQGVWQTDLRSADWDSVFDISIDALEKRSKDLQIAAWLVEALIHKGGFQGAVEGMILIRRLCERFWDTVFPLIEEGDLEFRVSPFVWMNSILSEKLKVVPVTRPQDQEIDEYTFLEWERIVHLEALAKQSASARKNLDTEKKYTKAMYYRSVDATSPAFFESAGNSLKLFQHHINELGAFLDQTCGEVSPGLGQLRKTVEEMLVHIERHVKKEEGMTKADDGEESMEQNDLSRVAGVTKHLKFDGQEQIKSREEAFHLLAEIAEYLLEIEPHSPVPFLVKRAVNWGSMSLGELLTELLKDGQNLQQVYTLLGIQE